MYEAIEFLFYVCPMIDSISADDFNVTLPFLLQQAAWLYDRQLSQVRAQMLKVGNTHSQSPSQAPAPTLGSVSGSGALGGQAMRRLGSGGEYWKIRDTWMRLKIGRIPCSVEIVRGSERRSTVKGGKQRFYNKSSGYSTSGL